MEELKVKFPDVKEGILLRVATKLADTVTEEAQVKPSVDGVTIMDIIERYVDSRTTEAVRTAVANYETKYGLKDGKPTGRGNGAEEKPKNEQSDSLQGLVDEIKALQQQVAGLATDKVRSQRATRLNGIIGKLPETERKAYSYLNTDNMSDEDFDAMVGSIQGDVDARLKEINAQKVSFGIPKKSSPLSGDGDKGIIDEVVDKMRI